MPGAAQDLPVFADDVMAISFEDGSGVETTDGTGKAEHYDVAMFLEDSSLTGKSVVGVRIPFGSVEDISGLKVWMASGLQLSESDRLPICDIAEVSCVATQGWTDVVFEEPFVMEGSGLYIGYSFDVDKINSNNLKPVCLTSVVSGDGYYIHTSRTAKYKQSWTNVNEKSNVGSLRMQVMVKGMEANAASIEAYSKINVQLGEVAYAPVRITCHGYNGVSSIGYQYEINGVKGDNTYELETPIAAVYNKYADIDIPLGVATDLGQVPFSVNVVTVNGAENTDLSSTTEGTLNVFDFVPVHRPLFEEYTGAWCGNCPRGLAAIEEMKVRHPEDFICISYHNSDAMEIASSFPSEIRGFPDSWISRKKQTDPFFGDKEDGQFHLDEEWEKIRKDPATVSIDVEAEWSDDTESAIEVKTRIISQIHYPADALAIGCALIADDLHGDTRQWWQHNYYSGESETCAPELKWIAELPSLIKDFHFNDVLILGKNLDGLESNLAYDIEPMNVYETGFTLPLSDAVNTSGENLVQDKSKLRVVAFCMDRAANEIYNANQTGFMESSGIEPLIVDSEIESVEYYDLVGTRVDRSATGVILKVTYHRDGTRKCEKMIAK